jgi:hypothetical protein
MLEASALVAGACFNCFEDPLKLDFELIGMRVKLASCMKNTAGVINNQILTE